MNSALNGILQPLPARKAMEHHRAVRNGELRYERGQAATRIALTLSVLAYLLVSGPAADFHLWPPSWPTFLAAFGVLAVAVFVRTLRAAAPSDIRRMLAAAADIAAIGYVMAITGEAGVPLFALYLWITMAMGLRFGPRPLIANAVMSLLAFAAVVWVTPAWQALGSVSAAVFISLAALPAFTVRLLRQNAAAAELRSRAAGSSAHGPHAPVSGREHEAAAGRGQHSDGNERRIESLAPGEASWERRLSEALARLAGPVHPGDLRREQAQAKVRSVNSLLVLGYMVLVYHPAVAAGNHFHWLAFLIGFIGLSLAVLAGTLYATAPSLSRRVTMNVADVSIVTYGMIVTGEVGIPLFILYLSITLGNGFRFGRRAMMFSTALSLLGFCVVLALSPVWIDLASIAVAVMLVLALLPFSVPLVRHSEPGAGSGTVSNTSDLPVVQRLRSIARKAGARRVDELGREQGQAFVRLVNSLLVFGYLILCFYPFDLKAQLPDWFAFSIGFIAFSVLMLALAKRAGVSSGIRRTAGNIGDVGAISYVMIATGTAGIPLFILYLSTTLGNGFRFGVEAMKASAALSLAGFAAVVMLSPVWRELPVTVPIGVLLALVLLPAYAAHLIRQLASATQRAEEASAAKSRFIARMSHELRTPLTGILGTAELLETNKRLTREDRSLLQVIKDSVKVSMRQVDNVLDFSKIEAGKLAVEQVDFDVHEVINRSARMVRVGALEKGLRLMLRIDPAVPYGLVGDPHHLNEVLLNLLSNAIKFTERGYVSLEARLMDADEHAALIRFEVHDTGIGIDASAVAHIFDAFSQADTSTTRRYGGTGLGTTIAKQLIELMGGQLRVESTKGKGTVFAADIRFARQAQNEAKADAVIGGALAGARVLLVPREPGLADHLASRMSEWGASLSVVASLADATSLLARGIRLGNPVHAVLADARAVFDATGAHAAEDFLEKASLSATPVFLVCDVSPEAAQLRQWGYAGVLSYDLPPRLLFSALHASYTVESLDERGVVQVEPWAWGQSGRVKPRVLVADDNRTNLMILRKILERANYDVDTADNGHQALEMLQRHRYKVAVLDMHMPGRDGVEVMREYRFSRHGARTPIVMLTANATMDAKMESANAGADAYLTKPATAADVLSTIKKVLDDTEVHELRSRASAGSLPADVPLLNTEVIADLDRLYGDPGDMKSLLETFEGDSRRLLQELRTAVEAKDQLRFRDLVHALKGNAANIGALRLVHACYEAEHLGVLDICRDGRKLLEQLDLLLAETLAALHDFTGVRDAEPKSDPRTPAGPGVL